MSGTLQEIIKRVVAGSGNEQDIQAIIAALQVGQITLADGDRTAGIGRDAANAIIVTGDKNIIVQGAVAKALQAILPHAVNSPKLSVSLSTDELVQRMRLYRYTKIQYQCGKIELLNSCSMDLDSLYVDVNILDSVSSQQWRDYLDLIQDFDPVGSKFELSYLGKTRQKRLPGLLAANMNTKLMVMGRPGSGKSTYLKYLAIMCNKGEFQSDFVPIFISLKKLVDDIGDRFLQSPSETSLIKNYIIQDFEFFNFTRQETDELIRSGRSLILLDGLDEISEQNSKDVCNHIEWFIQRYYTNRFVMTCRIKAQERKFYGFFNTEIADYNQQQIEDFIKKWFSNSFQSHKIAKANKATKLISELKRVSNQRIRELTVTPILLNLICLVFTGLSKLPKNRAELYEKGLDILLRQWDETKGIVRDEIYRGLSLANKINLLTQIASTTFKQGEYFIKKDNIRKLISNYLHTLANSSTSEDQLYLDSEIVLRVIEVQHGLLVQRAQQFYSFSHLTFQEYFTAKALNDTAEREALDELANSAIAERRWREVFLLTIEMSKESRYLLKLTKQKADQIIGSDEQLQQLLVWLSEKSLITAGTYKPVAVRAFYLFLTFHFLERSNNLGMYIDFIHNLDDSFDSRLSSFFSLDMNIVQAFSYATSNIFDTNFINALRQAYETSQICDQEAELNLREILYKIEKIEEQARGTLGAKTQVSKERLEKNKERLEKIEQIWLENKYVWFPQLKQVLVIRNMSCDWQFSELQKQLLQQYYDANKLLVECFESGHLVSEQVKEIEDTLLLPMSEIEKREQKITNG